MQIGGREWNGRLLRRTTGMYVYAGRILPPQKKKTTKITAISQLRFLRCWIVPQLSKWATWVVHDQGNVQSLAYPSLWVWPFSLKKGTKNGDQKWNAFLNRSDRWVFEIKHVTRNDAINEAKKQKRYSNKSFRVDSQTRPTQRHELKPEPNCIHKAWNISYG